ncbi:hypothetical protein ACWEQ7_02790 [Streptomyces sp. NPDC004069]
MGDGFGLGFGFAAGFGAWLVGVSEGVGDDSLTDGVGGGVDAAGGALDTALLAGVRTGEASLSESDAPHPTLASPTAAAITKVRFSSMPGTLARPALQRAEVTYL